MVTHSLNLWRCQMKKQPSSGWIDRLAAEEHKRVDQLVAAAHENINRHAEEEHKLVNQNYGKPKMNKHKVVSCIFAHTPT